MVVTGRTVGALGLLRELREAQCNVPRLQERVLALVTLDTRLAAGEGGKEVIVVHGADLVRIPTPLRRAETAGDPIDAHQTLEADGREKERVVSLAFHLEGRDVGFQRREIERAIDERELVVHVELTATQNAVNLACSVKCEAREDEGPRVISSAVPIVLHLDVVGIDQVAWDELFEDLVAGAMGKWLHVWRSILTRNGVAVVSSAPHSRSQHHPVGDLVGERHLIAEGLFPLSFRFVCALGRHGRVLLERTLGAAAGAQLVDQIVAFLGPQILATLLLGPVPRSAHSSEAAQHLLLETNEALVVHELAVGTLVVAALHLDRFYLGAGRIYVITQQAVFRTTAQRERIHGGFSGRVALRIAQFPLRAHRLCRRREMGLQAAVRPRRRRPPPGLLFGHRHGVPRAYTAHTHSLDPRGLGNVRTA